MALIAPINQLPTEILIHIFTIGADDDDMERVSRRGASAAESPRGRRIKPFVRRLSTVCGLWRFIARDEVNSHFWTTSLRLSALERMEITEQIERFRRDLYRPHAGDIDVSLRSNHKTPSHVARLLIHSMLMLKPFRRKLHRLTIDIPANLYPIVTDFLNQPALSPRLFFVFLSENTPRLPPAAFDTDIGFYDPRFYRVGASITAPLDLTSMPHLSQLFLSSDLNHFPIVSTTVTRLTISIALPASINTIANWGKFLTFFPHLRDLSIWGLNISDARFLPQTCRMPHLTSVAISGSDLSICQLADILPFDAVVGLRLFVRKDNREVEETVVHQHQLRKGALSNRVLRSIVVELDVTSRILLLLSRFGTPSFFSPSFKGTVLPLERLQSAVGMSLGNRLFKGMEASWTETSASLFVKGSTGFRFTVSEAKKYIPKSNNDNRATSPSSSSDPDSITHLIRHISIWGRWPNSFLLLDEFFDAPETDLTTIDISLLRFYSNSPAPKAGAFKFVTKIIIAFPNYLGISSLPFVPFPSVTTLDITFPRAKYTFTSEDKLRGDVRGMFNYVALLGQGQGQGQGGNGVDGGAEVGRGGGGGEAEAPTGGAAGPGPGSGGPGHGGRTKQYCVECDSCLMVLPKLRNVDLRFEEDIPGLSSNEVVVEALKELVKEQGMDGQIHISSRMVKEEVESSVRRQMR